MEFIAFLTHAVFSSVFRGCAFLCRQVYYQTYPLVVVALENPIITLSSVAFVVVFEIVLPARELRIYREMMAAAPR